MIVILVPIIWWSSNDQMYRMKMQLRASCYTSGIKPGLYRMTAWAKKEVDATESINGNSDRFHLGTASINRDPLRDKSNCCLIKYAGTLTLEAVDALRSNFAVNKECMKYKSILGDYPRCYRGLGKCHLRALYSVSPQAAKLALSKKVKTPWGVNDTRMPSTVQRSQERKSVSITRNALGFHMLIVLCWQRLLLVCN